MHTEIFRDEEMLYLSISNGYGENEAKFKQFINLALGIQQFLALSLKLFYNFEIILNCYMIPKKKSPNKVYSKKSSF